VADAGLFVIAAVAAAYWRPGRWLPRWRSSRRAPCSAARCAPLRSFLPPPPLLRAAARAPAPCPGRDHPDPRLRPSPVAPGGPSLSSASPSRCCWCRAYPRHLAAIATSPPTPGTSTSSR
jgi:hypothetical protein